MLGNLKEGTKQTLKEIVYFLSFEIMFVCVCKKRPRMDTSNITCDVYEYVNVSSVRCEIHQEST